MSTPGTQALRTARLLGIAVAASSVLVACGNGGGSKSTPAPKDTTPPEINQVSATLGTGTLDLGKSDTQRVIATPTPLTLKVFATDDITITQNLTVQALDDSNQPIADQSANLHNGLWQITTTAKPGLTIHVAATDEAGNQTVWPHAAVFPTREQALVQTWTLLVYDNQATAGGVYPVLERPEDKLTKDTWCQDDDAAGSGPQGGTWSVLADGRLKLETRDNTACDTADLTKPVQSARTSGFYVDATYFSAAPYVRQGSGSAKDITGAWSYKVDIASGGQSQTLTPTLTLSSDNTFTRSTEDGHTLQGTYKVEPNPNYSADFGQLLVLTVNQKDGASVTPVLEVHYYDVTQDLQLLVDPLVQIP